MIKKRNLNLCSIIYDNVCIPINEATSNASTLNWKYIRTISSYRNMNNTNAFSYIVYDGINRELSE